MLRIEKTSEIYYIAIEPQGKNVSKTDDNDGFFRSIREGKMKGKRDREDLDVIQIN